MGRGKMCLVSGIRARRLSLPPSATPFSRRPLPIRPAAVLEALTGTGQHTS